jgi:hypothetical protein
MELYLPRHSLRATQHPAHRKKQDSDNILLIKNYQLSILQCSTYVFKIKILCFTHLSSMLHTRRYSFVLLAVVLTVVSLVGFSGVSWCADRNMAGGSILEMASCHAESGGSMLALMPCRTSTSSNADECEACLDITSQALSGWRIGEDRPKATPSLLPGGNCSPFTRLAGMPGFADTSYSILLAAKNSPRGLTIQAEALRSVVLLI